MVLQLMQHGFEVLTFLQKARARAHGSQKWPMKGGWGQQGEREDSDLVSGMLTL